MNEIDFSMREEMIERRTERAKCIHKKWKDFPTGLKAFITYSSLAAQLAVLAFIYAFFAYNYSIFFYISLGLTLLSAIHVFIGEKDVQTKSSWLLLFIASFGCGYVVYLLADKRTCYGYDKRRFSEIASRTKCYSPQFVMPEAAAAVKNDIGYIYNTGGYLPYSGTDLRYFSSANTFFDNLLLRLEGAKKFVFIEFFIVADCVLLERFLSVLKRKVAEGVEVKMLYDDAGSQGVLTKSMKKRLLSAGIDLRLFARMLAPFSFGLNFRDHRKIVVVDGKTGYVGGCNIADECTNYVKMQGFWKDAGVRLDGAAVDGLTITFLRQWEFATRERVEYTPYLNLYESTANTSVVVPYAGGPEIEEALCRGVYENMIAGAHEKLYIMTPYFVPDGELLSLIKAKALSGVDVRIVLPAEPDYAFIYRVTRSNAERLMKSGVKIYYVKSTFVHSKVLLTENAAAVGSVNLDMRAFFLEFDNGVYTDDKNFMADVNADFEGAFSSNDEALPQKHGVFDRALTAFWRIFSPLM